MLITARKRGLRRLCFHKRLSFCPWGRGVCIQLGLGRPLLHWILQDTVNERSVRILLKCILVFTARKQSLGQGNIFIGVCQEFCSQGEFLPQCMLRYTPPPPRSRHPPGADPPEQTPPRADAPLGADTPLEAALPPEQTLLPGSRHSSPGADTPLEQTPPSEADTLQSRHPPEQTPPKADTPPKRRACWEIRSMRGRYASYWNAIWCMDVFVLLRSCILCLIFISVLHHPH